MTWTSAFGLLMVALSFASGAIVAVAASRRSALLVATLVSAAAAAVVWGAGRALMAAGWRDVDGWVDCYPHCDAWHRVGAFLFWAPPLFALALLVAAPVAVVARRRHSRRRSRG